MSQLKQNLLANFAGRAWYALMSLLFVPLYIRFMGMEAYGLVGFFVSLQALLSMFDFGLGTTFNREMARYSVQRERSQDALDLARTLEVVYWGVGILIGCVVFALAGLIGREWVKAEQLDSNAVSHAIALMGLVLTLQWPVTLYEGGLRGLEHPVLLNVIKASSATVRGVGAILTLWLISPSIYAFFCWQVIVSLLQTFVTGFGLWSCMPKTGRCPRLKLGLLKTVWSFAAGLSTLSLIMILLGQLDKVILSKILTLSAFGYYSLASTVAYAISIPMAPIAESFYPRMSQLTAQNVNDKMGQLYHQGAQLSALVLFPVGGILLFFSKEILFLWTGDLLLAANSELLVSILSLGVLIQFSVMGMLDVVQMSYGWLKPAFYSRLLALLLLGPIMFFMTTSYGVMGAAIAWLLICCGYLLLTPHFVFRRVLLGEKWSWYLNDLMLPFAVGIVIVGMGRVLHNVPASKTGSLLYLLFVFIISLLGVALSMRYTRQLIASRAIKFVRGLIAT